jgi:septal ring factor EnvC (AmiA/AmiB activator)
MGQLIIQILSILLGSGGIAALFLVAEKKAAAQIRNTDKIDDKWQRLIEQKEKDYSFLNSRYEEATQKIDKLYEDNSQLRTSLDNINTECAVGRILRCNRIECGNRQPPFGTDDNLNSNSNE